jgi:hypothetical protein
MSLGSVAAAALISLFGSVFTASGLHLAFNFIALRPLAGATGVAGLRNDDGETRLAIESRAGEAELTARPAETS